MKVAVCYSGLCEAKDWNYTSQSVKHHFDCPTFYSTWSSVEKHMPKVPYTVYPEPIMEYHPIADMENKLLTPKLRANKKNMAEEKPGFGPAYRLLTYNQTKPILSHAYQLEELDSSYDMIVRVRFDTYLSPKVDLNYYLHKAYEENIAIGFGTRTSRHPELYKLEEIPRVYPDRRRKGLSLDWVSYLMEPLILHPRNLFKTNKVFRYHEQKLLLPAENGWYQMLSEPYGDSHLSVYGGAQIEKYLPQTQL
jgi:hypothetical protein